MARNDRIADRTLKRTFDERADRQRGEIEIGIHGVIERALSRRALLQGAAALAASAAVGSPLGLATPARAGAARFAFAAVAANSEDTVTVPAGYSWQVVMSWGDPLWSDAAPFDPATRGTAASQARAFGDNTDGMHLFALPDGRNVLAVNNEYVNIGTIHGDRVTRKPETADDVAKSKAAHGVTICEIAERDGKWQPVADSPFNRRITADTPIDLSGPAAGHDLLKTAADPSGRRALGTWNNCANGVTPWGTYLSCEENFDNYFSASDPAFAIPAELQRYGIGAEDAGYGWAKADERFDVAKHPNEPNRAGYVVEIDPLDPASIPKKRTALGRFKHENAELAVTGDGTVVVYMGDDERGEFLYRFIADRKFVAGGDNRDLLDTGRLYVAKFHDDLRGEWLELSPAATGMSAADICIHTRQAASKVGATTMDRPEWVAVNPNAAEAYCALTNNKNRGKKPNAGGDAQPVGGPNPRAANEYGQIVRWAPDGGDHAAPGFHWDLFVVAGNPGVHSDARRGSANVTTENMFNSPDGLKFDSTGTLWIQTDGGYSGKDDFAGMGNNQMLAADPVSGEIRRFLVGPKECEVTGLTWSADRRTMFVGIQHPGEKGGSHFPGGGDSVPRSSVIAIRRSDGGPVG